MKDKTIALGLICDEITSRICEIDNGNIGKSENSIEVLFFLTQLMRSKILVECGIKEREIDLLIEKTLNNIVKQAMSISTNSISIMNSDLGRLAFCINEINKNTGYCNAALKSLNGELLRQSLNRIKLFKKSATKDYYYDCLSGIAGALNYFLITSNIEDNLLSELVSYLVELTECITIGKREIIGYYANYKFMNKKTGYVDFGMAHGIAGVLVALSKAYSHGVRDERLVTSMHKIVSMIDEYSIKINGIIRFPRRLSYKDYVGGKCTDITVNSGWCYGNLGIVAALINAMRNIGDSSKYEKYREECILILRQPVEYYNLDSPIICHGYGSVISMQTYLYNKTRDTAFLENIERNLDRELDLFLKKREGILNYGKDFSLLQGYSGSVLSMVNAITMDLSYGRLLLME